MSTGVDCIYCGESHERAADVRACWERARAGGAAESRPATATPVSSSRGPTDELTETISAPARSTAEPAGVRSAAGPPRRAVGQLEPVLGRSVVVRPGQEPPEAWVGCRRVTAAPASLDELEAAWRERRPLVIELREEPPAAEVEGRPVWSLDPSFALPGERLSHAVFTNAVDARSGTPRWRWAEEAVRLGAQPGGPADVVLADGRPALCDGGPTEWLDASGAAVVPRVTLLGGSVTPLGANDTVAELAPDQQAVVTHPGAAARIIAPAGSGKTRVLTERARHLLHRWNVPGRVVTLVAFNRRAAAEMKERTTDLPELQVRTLNALGLSLIGGLEQAATIDEREVRAILDMLVDLPRRSNTDPAAAWIEALSAVRLGLLDPEEVEAEFGGDVDGLPEVFEKYRRVLADKGSVDFDEQIYRSIEILLADPAARRSARARCRLLLVDEFQDLTPAHVLLIRLLAGPEGAVFGVGDDDQTIYGYSGASPTWLIDYRRFFPGASEHPLEVNYRCPTAVVAGARTLLTHNRRRIDKRIVAAPGRSPEPPALATVGGDDPLPLTVARVQELVDSGVPPKNIAVLTRVNASLAPVQVALVHHEVPVRKAVDETYLSRGGVQASLAWLRLATAGEQTLAGRDVAVAARRPARGLSTKVIEWMSEQRSGRDLERLAGRLRDRDADKILEFVADLTLVRRRTERGDSADVLRAVRDRVGLDAAMELLEGSRRRLDRSAQRDDLDALVALATLHPDPQGFAAWLRQSLGHGGHPDGVVLATIHSVKGQEWAHVVVHDVRAGLLPHRLANDVEEERRVFHVAITRCAESVTVVAGQPPSPFLDELRKEWTPSTAPVRARAARPTQAPPTSASRPSREAPVMAAALGMELAHGGHRGSVVAVDGDGVLVEIGRARVRVPFGAMVEAKGRSARLVPEPPSKAVVARAREALRAWRLEQSRAKGKPAFVIFSDVTLDEIAASMPSSTAALAKVKGIGPAKLDAYGDEILAVLDELRQS